MSPASGDPTKKIIKEEEEKIIVSIQLMSPASGDQSVVMIFQNLVQSFHSINVPSEWGQVKVRFSYLHCKVSIQLMSPASGDLKLQ